MAEARRTTARENLYRADGSRRPNAEVLNESGDIGLRLALLDDAMHRRGASIEPDSWYPPQLFLSYKWGTEAENAWVAQLAQRLMKHGWDVVFDRQRDETADREVEDFVSRLVSCRVFVAVLSPGFVASAVVAKHASWVFDEMQCALLARHRTYSGPCLTADEHLWVAERLVRSGDEASLREILDRHPFVSGGWRRLVVLLRDRGDTRAALEAVLSPEPPRSSNAPSTSTRRSRLPIVTSRRSAPQGLHRLRST